MATNYPIVANCNFESRDDERGRTVHAARKAVEAGLTDDADLIAALDGLEDTLAEYAETDNTIATEACRGAERAVADAWTAGVREAVEAARIARFID